MWFLRHDVLQPLAAKSMAQLFHFRHPEREYNKCAQGPKARFSSFHARRAWFVAGFPFLVLESGRFRGVIRFKTVGLRLDKLFACLNLRYRPLRSINFA